MASGVTKIADVVVPSVFTPYVRQKTEEKSRLVQSGILVRSSKLDQLCAGGGLTFNVPSWKDIDNEAENVSSDDDGTSSTPKKIGSGTEIAVRLNRNQSWSSMDLAEQLAGDDPMSAIGDRVANYWALRRQACFVAIVQGIFNDNAAAPSGTEHVQNDMTRDISGSSYSAGVTDFSAEAFVDTILTMGDSMDSLGMLMVHSVVYARMLKNNMIDFIPDSQTGADIPTFMGREVIVDDGLPNPAGLSANGSNTATGIYHSWVFARGTFLLGDSPPPVPTETGRSPAAGNGGGQDTLYSRVQYCIHPIGHKYAGTAPNGGPTNANSSNNLSHAGSWQRVYPERKQIKLARLITREA